MSYQPPYQGFGAPPQGYGGPPNYPPQDQSQYPPQNPYPPSGGYPAQPYGSPAPPQVYGTPSPQPFYGQSYGAPSGPTPQQYVAPPQQYGAPPQPYGGPSQQHPPQQSAYQPPPQSYGAPPQSYGAPQPYAPPTPPSVGYGPRPHIPWDATADADALRKAMKGFGTDEKTLIHILSNKDPWQIALIREVYNQRHRRNLEADIASEVSGYFEHGLLAIVRGPLQQDVYLLHRAMSGPGTKETVLNDVLLARSNADMAAIKHAYQATYHQSLENMLRADLSMKTERHFMMVVAGNRAEDSAPVIPQQIDQDVLEIYKATEGKIGTDELLVCSIMSTRNDAQIRAIAHAYEARFRRPLETVIRKEFSGHMEHALLYQLGAGKDRIMRDAELLEAAMAGIGTKDELLVNRVVRYHWDRNHMHQVKAAYRQRYSRDLGQRIRGETSGHYEMLMLACIGG